MITRSKPNDKIRLSGSKKLTDALEVLVEGRDNADYVASEARQAGFSAVIPDQDRATVDAQQFRVTIVPCAGTDLRSVEKFFSDHPGFELTD